MPSAICRDIKIAPIDEYLTILFVKKKKKTQTIALSSSKIFCNCLDIRLDDDIP